MGRGLSPGRGVLTLRQRFRWKGEAKETGQKEAQSTEAGTRTSLSNHPPGADDWILPGENEGGTGPARPNGALSAHCKTHVSAFAETASFWLQPLAIGRERIFILE